MFYEVIKTGLTAFNRVFVKGEQFSEEEAVLMGLDVWFKETEGKTWAGHFIVKKDGKKAAKVSQSEESNMSIAQVIQDSGLTVEAIKDMKWNDLVKQFKKTKLAKAVKDYVESNNT